MKNYLKKVIVFLCFATLFTSCEKDLYEEQIKNDLRNISVGHISLNDIDKNTSNKISEKISMIKSFHNKATSILGKLEFNTTLGIYLDTENGKLVNNNGKLYYTFPMCRENEEKLENIVFTTLDNGELETFFVKYAVTPEEFKQLSVSEIENLNPEFQKIYFDGPEYVCINFFQTVQLYPNCETQHPNGPCDNLTTTVFVGSYCSFTFPGGSGLGSDTGGGDGGVGGNTTGGHTGTGSNSVATTVVYFSPEDIRKKDFSQNDLTPDERTWFFNPLNSVYKKDIYDFLEQSLTDENGFISTQYSVDIKNFVKEMILRIKLNPEIFTSIKPFIIEKQINDTELDVCTKGDIK